MKHVANLRLLGTGSTITSRLGGLLVAGTLALVLLAFLVVGLSAVGAADDGLALNETVSYESDDDPLELEVAFNDSIDDADAEADVLFYEDGEYGDNGSTVVEETISADAGQTVAQTIDWADYDALEYGEEYTVVVEDGDHIEYVDRLDGGLFGGGGGGADSVPGFGAVVAVVALATAGVLAVRRG